MKETKPTVTQLVACLTHDRKATGSSHDDGEPWTVYL